MLTLRTLALVSCLLVCNAFSTSAVLQRVSTSTATATSERKVPLRGKPVVDVGKLASSSAVGASVVPMESMGNPGMKFPDIDFKSAGRRLMVPSVSIAAIVLAYYLSRKLYLAKGFFDSVMLFGESVLTAYKESMVLHPLRTKVATGASLAVLGDAIAQSRDSDHQYDSRRAVSFAAFDSCYRMFQHVAFPTIVSMCEGRFLGGILSLLPIALTIDSGLKQFLAAMERTLTYQLGVIPLLYYPVFFTFTGIMQGLTLRQTFERAEKNFLPCWKKNLMFWIPIQLVMFGWIDEKWQIPFVCVMGMIWATILSVTAGRAKEQKTSKN